MPGNPAAALADVAEVREWPAFVHPTDAELPRLRAPAPPCCSASTATASTRRSSAPAGPAARRAGEHRLRLGGRGGRRRARHRRHELPGHAARDDRRPDVRPDHRGPPAYERSGALPSCRLVDAGRPRPDARPGRRTARRSGSSATARSARPWRDGRGRVRHDGHPPQPHARRRRVVALGPVRRPAPRERHRVAPRPVHARDPPPDRRARAAADEADRDAGERGPRRRRRRGGARPGAARGLDRFGRTRRAPGGAGARPGRDRAAQRCPTA